MTTRFRQTTVEAFASLVLLIVVLALSLLAGCLPPAPKPVDPKPDPPPVVLTPERAAHRFASEYSLRLSDAARTLAEDLKADEGRDEAAKKYPDLVAVNDEWIKKSTDARLKSQQVLIDAMNSTLTDPTGEKPGTVAATLFEQLANGFKKGSGL